MRRVSCLLLGVLLPWAGLEAATVYRSTDAQGNVVFSDQPRDDSERIQLEPLTLGPSLEADMPRASDAAPASDGVGRTAEPVRSRPEESRPDVAPASHPDPGSLPMNRSGS